MMFRSQPTVLIVNLKVKLCISLGVC